jgi:hypothetical protein
LHVDQLRAVAGEEAVDGDEVADLGGISSPPGAIQRVRRAALDGPMRGGAAGFRDVDVEVDVRVRPFHPGDGALQGDRLLAIVLRGEGMMGRDRQAGGQDADGHQQSRDPTFHLTLRLRLM